MEPGMEFEEARALLGVGSDATPEHVRRAYLRLIRKHPPESDPEGFQRARAAWETLDRPPPPPVTSGPPPGEPWAPVARTAQRSDPRPDLRAAVRRALAGDTDGAAEDVLTALELATGSAAALDVLPALQVLLILHLGLHSGRASDLEAALARWIAMVGEARALQENGVRWRLARELGALGGDFPNELRAAAAAALLEDNLEVGRRVFMQFAVTHPTDARPAADALAARAPMLYSALGDALRWRPRPASDWTTAEAIALGSLIAIVAFAVGVMTGIGLLGAAVGVYLNANEAPLPEPPAAAAAP